MPRDATLVLIACCLAMLSVGENSTAIMAALPEMTRSLELGPATVEWAVNAYLLASAIFIILGGEAADQFGPRRSSAGGIALFALASMMIALAPNGAVVIGARALQGFGAAFAVAGTLAAVTEAAPEAKRAGAISAWTGFLMLGFSIGPLVGGALTHYAGWRAVFWLNVVAMTPAALALWLNPGTGDRKTKPVDWLGLCLLAVFMVTLISGLHALPTARSAPQAAIVPLALAAIALAALMWAETRHHRPLLDFGLFADRNFALACALVFLLMFDIMTLLLYFNLFAQAPAGTWLERGRRRPLAHAALACAVRLRACGATARGRGRCTDDDGRRIAAARAWLRDRLDIPNRWRIRVADARSVRSRRRHCAALCISAADRAGNVAADANRQRLRRAQFVQLSRWNRRGHRRWTGVRSHRLRRRARAGGTLRAGRRGALVAAARSVRSGAYRWLTFPIYGFPHSLQSVWAGFPRSQSS